MFLRQLRSTTLVLLALVPLVTEAANGPKVHVISYGKSLTVKLLGRGRKQNSADESARAICRCQTEGIRDRDSPRDNGSLFVVRRAYRLNNSLPTDESKAPNWVWERGGWLMVDRLTGRFNAAFSLQLRSVLFGGKLVPRLCCVLRSERQW